MAVISGQDTGGISFTLALGGSIAGVVRDTSGNAISNADVWANSYVCCGGGNGARSDGQGEYLIQGLPAGEYRVTSDASRQGYSRQFYTGTAAWDLAIPVTVVGGTTTREYRLLARFGRFHPGLRVPV